MSTAIRALTIKLVQEPTIEGRLEIAKEMDALLSSIDLVEYEVEVTTEADPDTVKKVKAFVAVTRLWDTEAQCEIDCITRFKVKKFITRLKYTVL